MPAHILTGAPGSGKTAVLRLLETFGYAVIEEAATDVIALEQALGHPEPWAEDGFIDKILALQQRRQAAARVAAGPDGTVFFDRSPVCTLALARFLEVAVPPALSREVSRTAHDGTVFFIRNQGFVEPTAARRISFADSLDFERLHEGVYRDFGFEVVDVPAGPLPDRVSRIREAIAAGPVRRRSRP